MRERLREADFIYQLVKHFMQELTVREGCF